MTDVGRTGEAVAAKYYQQRGWLLLNHNYRTRLGELDLILYKENTLVFAEVKTRTGVNKLKNGQAEQIHRCLRCNKKCLGGLMAHQGTRCVYDALREKEAKNA